MPAENTPAAPAHAPADPAPTTHAAPAPAPADGATPPAATPDPSADEAGLGEAGKRALAAERDARKAAEKSATEALAKLQQIEDEKLSELEKAQKTATEASARLAEIEATSLRQKVALDKGIPAALVARLQGATEEELAADADALLGLMNAPRTPAPDPGQGPRGNGPQSEDDKTYEALFGAPATQK